MRVRPDWEGLREGRMGWIEAVRWESCKGVFYGVGVGNWVWVGMWICGV